MKFGLLLEAYLSDYKYEIPEDKELLLYDFYMLEFLDKGPSLSVAFVREEDEEASAIALKETKALLLDYLKEHLLDVVFIAIAGELENLFDGGIFAPTGKSFEEREKSAEKIRDYKRFALEEIFNYSTSPTGGIRNIRIKKLTVEEKAKICEKAVEMFNKKEWDENYGGVAWARIAEGWLKLYNSPDGERYIWIDHVYDLCHNNNTVFNKIDDYIKKDRLASWVKFALDFKANLKTPQFILLRCSETMKKLATFILKQKGYPALEIIKSQNQIFLDDRLETEILEAPVGFEMDESALSSIKNLLTYGAKPKTEKSRQKLLLITAATQSTTLLWAIISSKIKIEIDEKIISKMLEKAFEPGIRYLVDNGVSVDTINDVFARMDKLNSTIRFWLDLKARL